MQYFWETKFTIVEGNGFSLFDVTHIFWIILFIAICVILGKKYRKFNEKSKKTCLKIVCILLVTGELLKDIITLAMGKFNLDFLPLHLCSINIFFIIAYTIKPNKYVGEVLYALCLPGALLAILFPSCKELPILNFMHIQYFTKHILLFLYPYLLLLRRV